MGNKRTGPDYLDQEKKKKKKEKTRWQTMEDLMKNKGRGAKKVRRGSLDAVNEFLKNN